MDDPAQAALSLKDLKLETQNFGLYLPPAVINSIRNERVSITLVGKEKYGLSGHYSLPYLPHKLNELMRYLKKIRWLYGQNFVRNHNLF